MSDDGRAGKPAARAGRLTHAPAPVSVRGRHDTIASCPQRRVRGILPEAPHRHRNRHDPTTYSTLFELSRVSLPP